MPKNLSRRRRQRGRVIAVGCVVSSDRIVWRLSEDDIVAAAAERGTALTQDQMDRISQYVDKHFCTNGEWLEVIDRALDCIGLPGSSDA